MKKAIPFLAAWKSGGEAGKQDLGLEREGLAQFTSNATAGILAAIIVLVPTGRHLVTQQVHSSQSPLLLAKGLESGLFILPAGVVLHRRDLQKRDCLDHRIVTPV